MDRYLPKEKENRKVGMGVSLGIHALILILFLFLAAWKEPYPPNPGIPGVELNFGIVDAGKGDAHKETKVNTQNTEDSKPEEASSPDVTEEIEEQNTPENQQTEVEGEKVQSTPVESPHIVKEKSENSAKNSKQEKVVEPAKPNNEKKDTPKEGGDGKDGEKSEATASSNGDKDVIGDQGDPKGKVDHRALYGTPGTGGGGGPQLDMAGWMWDNIPNKVDPSSEKGYVVFEFKVDDYGNVEWAKAKEKTVSPSVVKFYYDQLMRTTFTPTGNNIVNYVGRVRFEVKAQ